MGAMIRVLLLLHIVTAACSDLVASAYFDDPRHTTVLAAIDVACPQSTPLNACPLAMFWTLTAGASPTTWRTFANGTGAGVYSSGLERFAKVPPLPWRLRLLRHKHGVAVLVSDVQVAYMLLRSPSDGQPASIAFQTELGDIIPSTVMNVVWDQLKGGAVDAQGQHKWNAAHATAGSVMPHNGARYLYFPATTPKISLLAACHGLEQSAVVNACTDATSDPMACVTMQCGSQLCSVCGWWARVADVKQQY